MPDLFRLASLHTWTARHESGLKCSIPYRAVVERMASANSAHLLRLDATEVVVGSWTFIRGGKS